MQHQPLKTVRAWCRRVFPRRKTADCYAIRSPADRWNRVGRSIEFRQWFQHHPNVHEAVGSEASAELGVQIGLQAFTIPCEITCCIIDLMPFPGGPVLLQRKTFEDFPKQLLAFYPRIGAKKMDSFAPPVQVQIAPGVLGITVALVLAASAELVQGSPGAIIEIKSLRGDQVSMRDHEGQGGGEPD